MIVENILVNKVTINMHVLSFPSVVIASYLVIIITLQDRTRTVCDSLHVGRHSLRGIDG